MTGDSGEKPTDISATPDDDAASGTGAPTPTDIAAETPDTTDDNGMPVENPSGG